MIKTIISKLWMAFDRFWWLPEIEDKQSDKYGEALAATLSVYKKLSDQK